VIKELAQFIENGTAFVIGTNLLVGHRDQDAVDRCTVLLDNIGSKLYFDLDDRKDWTVQIISRANTYFTARDDAYLIYDFLHRRCAHDFPIVEVGTSYVAQTIEAITTPQFMGYDDKGRYEFVANYLIRIKDKV
jgi:hypothetical protein